MRHRHLTLAVSLAVAEFVSCANPSAPEPTVSFMIDAPLCSSKIPVELSVDNVLVATDTFIVNLGTDHLVSRAFTTSVGQHTLGARVTFNGYTWPEKRVTLMQGQSVTDTLPFYCS